MGVNKKTYFEGKKATNYDSFIPNIMPGYDHIIDKTPFWIVDDLKNTQNPKILVVGCGTGNETLKLAKHSDKYNITACDPSKDMVEIASNKLKNYNNVEILHSLIDNINSDKKHNVVILFLVLHFISDDGEKLNMLNQISNRLKPNGILYLWDISGNKEELKTNIEILKPKLLKKISLEKWNTFENTILNKLFTLDDNRLFELADQSGFEKPVLIQENIINKCWKLTLKS